MERNGPEIQGENVMNEIIHRPAELQDMAKAMAKLFNKSPEDLFALMLIAQAENKHPAIAAQEYDIINGRPALKSQATLSRFQASQGRIQWLKRDDTVASAIFQHPAGGELTVTWTIERATKAGLNTKDTWKKYPAQMLSSRVVAEGVRAIYPACLSGFYTSEEVADIDDRRPLSVPTQEVPEVAHKPKTIKPNKAESVQDAETVKTEDPPQEAKPQPSVHYLEHRKQITLAISEIVGAKDDPQAWTKEEKEALEIAQLFEQSKKLEDINLLNVALLRVRIGQKTRGTSEWGSSVKAILDVGSNTDDLEKILSGMAGELVGQSELELY
jgi:hypothetical protein